MADTESKSAAAPPPARVQTTEDVIVDSAVEALGGAFMVWVLGGVAISIAGSFAGDMIPSPPPGFDSHRYPGWHVVPSSAFVLFFAIFFVHSLWSGFHSGGGRTGRRMRRILSNLRENWFGLIVGNAISAWVAILILGCLPDISLVHMLWHWVWEMVVPGIEEIGRFILGAPTADGFGGWISWFEANQTKLTFWIIYLGGAFDDLGVPNFKTLARWAWRRMQKRKEMVSPATVERRDPA